MELKRQILGLGLLRLLLSKYLGRLVEYSDARLKCSLILQILLNVVANLYLVSVSRLQLLTQLTLHLFTDGPLLADDLLLVLNESDYLLTEETVAVLIGIQEEKYLEHLVGLRLGLVKVFHIDS